MPICIPANIFVDAEGALAVVDFGIMGRLDRATRYYLADMLIGFLTGDLPAGRRGAFRGRLRAPAALDRRLHPGVPLDRRADPRAPVARHLDRAPARAALSGDRAVRDGNPAATLAAAKDDGAGRRGRAAAYPEVNIWTLARPLVEEWMRDNRGPEARVRQQIDTLLETIDEIPRLLRSLDRMVGDWSREGVILHARASPPRLPDLGGFFLAHRDTEKAAGMFGTLIVGLPSAHRGGELVIRHAGREITVDMSGRRF